MVAGYGNIMNRVIESSKSPEEPKVGMPATIVMHSDRIACEIIEVINTGKSRRIKVRPYKATAKHKEFTDSGQDWLLESDEKQPTYVYRLRKNGAWVKDKEPMRTGERILVGVSDHYYDYSF